MRPRALARGNQSARGGQYPVSHASMRPQALARGNKYDSSRPSSRSSRFNEAASARSRKHIRCRVDPTEGLRASMRPRALARGNERKVCQIVTNGAASMRPRALARGNLRNDVGMTAEAELLQ